MSRGSCAPRELCQRRHRQPRGVELFPVELGGFAGTGPDDRPAAGMDFLGEPVAAVERDSRDDPGKGRGDVIKRVVVVVEDDDLAVAAEPGAGAGSPWAIDRLG
jgi:hypothetical protein